MPKGDHFHHEYRFRTLAQQYHAEANEILDKAQDTVEDWLLSKDNDIEKLDKFVKQLKQFKRMYWQAKLYDAKAEHHTKKQQKGEGE